MRTDDGLRDVQAEPEALPALTDNRVRAFTMYLVVLAEDPRKLGRWNPGPVVLDLDRHFVRTPSDSNVDASRSVRMPNGVRH